MPATFEEWLHMQLPEGHTIQDELRVFYVNLEQSISQFRDQIDRRELFLAVARCVYEHSVLYH